MKLILRIAARPGFELDALDKLWPHENGFFKKYKDREVAFVTKDDTVGDVLTHGSMNYAHRLVKEGKARWAEVTFDLVATVKAPEVPEIIIVDGRKYRLVEENES